MPFYSRLALVSSATALCAGAVFAQVPSTPTTATPVQGPTAPPGGAPLKGQIGNPASAPRPPAADVDPEKVRAAEAVTRAWVSLVDAGKYDESWSDASPLFQARVPQSEWIKAIGAKRGPYGAVKSRVFASIAPENAIPGAPIADYLTIRYSTEFEHGPAPVITEIVTAQRDPEGAWHVTGYGLP